MTQYHEPPEELDDGVRDQVRALTSLREEIEAVDWYTQRASRCSDQTLRRVLEHNRDEEIEHACMTLEWLRRTMPAWDEALRTYLFKSGDIVEIEEAAESDEQSARPPRPSADALASGLGVGSLRDTVGRSGK